jgi:hypothetical protein
MQQQQQLQRAAQQAVVVPGVPASSRDGAAGPELRGPDAALLSPRSVRIGWMKEVFRRPATESDSRACKAYNLRMQRTFEGVLADQLVCMLMVACAGEIHVLQRSWGSI